MVGESRDGSGNEEGESPREAATLGGGCFWCLEPIFARIRGVDEVVPGYAGGSAPNPTYEDVCTGETGHAEVVRITFDPSVVTYRELLRIFFTIHDPTTLNRQGADVGPQYRSIILHHSHEQQRTARDVTREAEHQHLWDAPVVTEIAPLETFYPAEEEHHDYFRKNPGAPYCQYVIAPKLAAAREKFRELWTEDEAREGEAT